MRHLVATIVVSGIVVSGSLALAGGDPLERAQQAYVDKRYEDAIKLARPEVAKAPDRAHRVIGSVQCALKDAAGAAETYKNLDGKGKEYLKFVCDRSGIKL